MHGLHGSKMERDVCPVIDKAINGRLRVDLSEPSVVARVRDPPSVPRRPRWTVARRARRLIYTQSDYPDTYCPRRPVLFATVAVSSAQDVRYVPNGS